MKYRERRPFEVLEFEKFIRVFDLSQFKLNRTDEDLFRSHYTMLNIKQLNHSIDSLSNSRIQRFDNYRDKFVQRLPYLALLRNDTTAAGDTLKQPDAIIPDTGNLGPTSLFDTVADTIVHKVLTYPLLANYSLEDQAKIVDIALKEARNTRDNIIFYKNDLDNRQQVITKHEVVWHQKFKLSLACLIFFFIGAPLGAIIRKGGLGLPVVVSVVFFVIYHIISMTGEKAAKTGEWDVVFGSWLSTVLILPLGLFLTYKATTDAPLLDAESWKKSFGKLGKRLFSRGGNRKKD